MDLVAKHKKKIAQVMQFVDAYAEATGKDSGELLAAYNKKQLAPYKHILRYILYCTMDVSYDHLGFIIGINGQNLARSSNLVHKSLTSNSDTEIVRVYNEVKTKMQAQNEWPEGLY